MLATFKAVWHDLPGIVHVVWNIVFVVIILKGVATKDVAAWLEKRGFVRTKENGIIFKTLDFFYFGAQAIFKLVFISTTRKKLIWTHHKQQHPAKSITGCNMDSCRI